MEKVLKGYVFRMYPNQKQTELIEKSLGISRYIYNYFLNKNQNKKYFNPFNHIKELPSLCSENKWLKEVEMFYRKIRRVKIYFDFCSL